MTPELEEQIKQATALMDKTIEHLENELQKIRAGKATPQMLDSVFVDYYGVNTPLAQVANINTPDARTITVQPWEKSLLGAIEKAIVLANLGLNPQNDGTLIRIAIPPLTEERRKDLVKKAKSEGEHAKVGIRNIRRDINDHIKKMTKAGLAEDLAKEAEAKIQTKTDNYVKKIDELVALKEKDIMTI